MEYYSTQIYTSDGTLQEVTVGFFYRDREDIHVYIEGELINEWTWVGSVGSVIRLDSPVPEGEQLMIRRLTDLSRVPFVFGKAEGAHGNSEFSAQTIDDNFAYILEASQEALDVFEIVGVNLGSVQLWLDQLQEAIDNIADTLAYMELLRDETQDAYDHTLESEARALQSQLAALAAQTSAETAQAIAEQHASDSNSARLLSEAAAQAATISESAATASAALATTRAGEAEASRVAAANSATSASASSTSASNSATQAHGHATQAGTSASEALGYRNAAQGSASSAAASASNAATSANTAQDWAVKLDGPVAEGEHSSKYWAQQAASSVKEVAHDGTGTVQLTGKGVVGDPLKAHITTDVLLSIGQAQDTADDAQSAASAAQTTANSALTSANNAQTSANSAQSAADSAQTSADNAQVAASTAQSTADASLKKDSNLSDLTSVEAARDNLGLGSVASLESGGGWGEVQANGRGFIVDSDTPLAAVPEGVVALIKGDNPELPLWEMLV